MDDDEEEDEEVLQLKLQAIEAKLKLKKLQQAKAKREGRTDYSSDAGSRPPTAASLRPESSRTDSRSDVQVPLSPVRKARPMQEPVSPARVLLGIDKGLRAQDVSLKRPSSMKPNGTGKASDSLLSRSKSLYSMTDGETPQGKSYAERMAESRNREKEQEAKKKRIEQSRSTGFNLARTITPRAKTPEPATLTKTPGKPVGQTREEHAINQQSRPNPRNRGQSPPAESASKSDKPSILEPYSGLHLTKRILDHPTLTRALDGKAVFSIPQLLKEVKSPEYEPPDCESDYVILGIIASKSNPLEHRNNPKSINSSGSDNSARSKFMVVHLTDLKWELDLFLFDTGFEQFWKLTPGTVIGILNPGIMPPRVKESGAFCLKLTSSEDTVLEIGTAKDIGFCTAKKADGRQCLAWVDARKTEVCEYHISLKVDKARSGRMEFNTMVGLGGGPGSGSRGKWGGRGRGGGGRGGKGRGLLPEGKTYDPAIHETLYLAPKELGFSATRLLDDGDLEINAWQRGYSKEEFQKKKAREREKEAELAKKLGALGPSAGSSYLKSRTKTTSAAPNGEGGSAATVLEEPLSAEALGLIGKPSANPVKRKRSGVEASEPVGWGGAFRSGLPGYQRPTATGHGAPSSKAAHLPDLDRSLSSQASMSRPTTADSSAARPPPLKSARKDPDLPSPKKKARFMLAEKGLREPGRESLGGPGLLPSLVGRGGGKDGGDYDDDLEII
jgi:minichromosome maintenance protein 10